MPALPANILYVKNNKKILDYNKHYFPKRINLPAILKKD
jgi:hypothetical protein